MRVELKMIIGAHVALLLYLVYLLLDLISLVYDDSFQDAITEADLTTPKGFDRPEIVPRIMHQTYKTAELPEDWQENQQLCIDMHPDYEYKLWTDELLREFIAAEYPWFLDTWDGYEFNIQRADVIRYFVLLHYGGIYLDLDQRCERLLDALLTFPAVLRKTDPTGILNDFMVSVPKHPFFLKVIGNLNKFNRNWVVPYITIMYLTGPLFLLVLWKQYKRWGLPPSGAVRILWPTDHQKHTYAFIQETRGLLWHTADARVILRMADYIPHLIVAGTLIVLVVFTLEYMLYQCMVLLRWRRMYRRVVNSVLAWSGLLMLLLMPALPTLEFLFGRGKLSRAGRRSKMKRRDSNLPYTLPLELLDIDLEKCGSTDSSGSENGSSSSPIHSSRG